jgi:hypothetical protein
MILQDGFNPVSFDLWILMNKYQIPSILISDTEIPETNRKRNEFVCYKGNDDIYVFILIPAMYPRKGKILPKYSVIVNQNDDEQIRISELVMTDNQCLVNIRAAIERPEYAYSIEDFFDQNIFKKPAVKKHVNKAVKKGLDEEEDESEQEPIDKANLKIEEGRRAIDELLGEISAQALKTPNYRINADTFLKDYNDKYTKLITTAPNLTIDEIKLSKKAYKLYMNEVLN